MSKTRYSLSLAETALHHYPKMDLDDTDNESHHWTEGEWNDYEAKCRILDKVLEREKIEPGYIAQHKPVLGRILDWIEWCDSHLEWENYRQIWSIPLATFSDYSGTVVERANAESLKEKYDWLVQRGGAMGTEWLGISPPYLIDVDVESFSLFMNDITGLEDYPLIDEEKHSEMELQAQTEAWDNWVGHDFKSRICRNIQNSNDLTEEAADELEQQFDEVDDEYVYQFFNKAAELKNEYWIIETGGGAHIKLDLIADSLTVENIEDFLVEVEQDKCDKIAVQEILPAIKAQIPDIGRKKWLY